ncbi:MAG: aminoglycoside phosphotransferase family protein [Acidimicrobiia bacterium]|nr:aminoglycoside phosphotransferase family protein [Acidimicrobiia bacterium]NNC74002.1 aminoglycoside phosphotransferase family protein [Acidimicrobiia bacterium]
MTPQTEAWLRQQLGPEVGLGDPLTGGVTSDVRSVHRGSEGFVLKQVSNAEWLAERPDVIEYEARVIEYLDANSQIPVPRVIAIDPRGEQAGSPSMILSLIEAPPAGSVADPDDILVALAETATAIGQVEPPGWVRQFARYLDAGDAATPSWSHQPETWERGIARISETPPTTDPVFIHRDFHHWNVLWNGGVAGVVDWSQTSIGPSAMEVAHCRMNLVVEWGIEVADRFRSICETMTGARHHPYFDIVTLVDLLPDWRPAERENRLLDQYLNTLLAEA